MRKKISVFSSTITLVILLFLLILNLNAKKVGNEIWNATWRSIIPEGLVSNDSETKEWFNTILSTGNSQEESENIIDAKSIEKIMKEFSEETKEKKDEFTGEYMEKLSEFMEEKEKSMNQQQKQVLGVIRFLSNAKIKYILMILILMVLASIAVTLKSYHKWIPSLAWAMALSGIATIFLCELLKKYIFSYFKIEVTLNVLIDSAQYLIMGGIIIRIMYLIIESIANINKKIDKEEKNELSKVPEQ